MTTSTDTDTDDQPDEAPSSFIDRDAVRRGDPDPCPAFDGCRTPEEVNQRFKEGWAFAVLIYGDKYRVPSWFSIQWGEELRRAHSRIVGRVNGRPAGPATPRVSIQSEARPTEHDDGSLTIVCAGPCGEEKPVSKFPTLKGGPGRRGTVCRSCEAAIRAEKKSPGKA